MTQKKGGRPTPGAADALWRSIYRPQPGTPPPSLAAPAWLPPGISPALIQRVAEAHDHRRRGDNAGFLRLALDRVPVNDVRLASRAIGEPWSPQDSATYLAWQRGGR